MAEIKRKGELLSKEKRKAAIEEIIGFFKSEREEDIGIIAAGNILDFFLQEIGDEIYNKGVEDARGFIKSRIEDLELDMEILLKK